MNHTKQLYRKAKGSESETFNSDLISRQKVIEQISELFVSSRDLEPLTRIPTPKKYLYNDVYNQALDAVIEIVKKI